MLFTSCQPLEDKFNKQLYWAKEMKAYRFFVPRNYEPDPKKESEVKDRDFEKNIITFQVKDPVPIDYLDKMPDKDKDMKMLCEQVADDFLKNLPKEDFDGKDPLSLKRKLIRSRPFVRKQNLVVDKAINFCWETVLRFNKFDLYVTILRRSYIPPFADIYQDIIVCSKYELEDGNDMLSADQYESDEKRQRVVQRSYDFLKNKH